MDIVASLNARAHALIFALVVLVIAFIAKKADDWRTSKFDDDDEIANKGNLAVGIRRAGLLLGGIVAIAGALGGQSGGLLSDLVNVAAYGTAGYALLFAARFVCDKVTLNTIDDDDEIAKGNVAVGIVEFGTLLAIGIVLNGAMTGDDADLLHGLRGMAVFFVIAQAVLVLTGFIYQKVTPFNDQEELGRDNRAVAVEFAGMYLGTALIVRGCLVGPSSGFKYDLYAFGLGVATGVALLFAFQFLLRRAFLHKAKLNQALRDGNVAVAVTLQALTIAFAYLIATVVV